MRRCKMCGLPIDGKRANAIYCGNRCAKRAERVRKSDAEQVRRIEPTKRPSRLAAPTPEDVAAMVSSALGIAASFRLAAQKSDYRLRAMCRRLAEAIESAIDSEVG